MDKVKQYYKVLVNGKRLLVESFRGEQRVLYDKYLPKGMNLRFVYPEEIHEYLNKDPDPPEPYEYNLKGPCLRVPRG